MTMSAPPPLPPTLPGAESQGGGGSAAPELPSGGSSADAVELTAAEASVRAQVEQLCNRIRTESDAEAKQTLITELKELVGSRDSGWALVKVIADDAHPEVRFSAHRLLFAAVTHPMPVSAADVLLVTESRHVRHAVLAQCREAGCGMPPRLAGGVTCVHVAGRRCSRRSRLCYRCFFRLWTAKLNAVSK